MSVIEKHDELEAYFHNAGKPRGEWRVGTEYEKVGIDRTTGKAIPYFGPRGVDRILRELMDRFDLSRLPRGPVTFTPRDDAYLRG